MISVYTYKNVRMHLAGAGRAKLGYFGGMFLIESYPAAVICCIVTMLCWGSWANTQKLAASTWRFELFYWDYVLGILLFSLLLALTLGSTGSGGRGFVTDLDQASGKNIGLAIAGGIV